MIKRNSALLYTMFFVFCSIFCGCSNQIDNSDLSIHSYGNTKGNIQEGGHIVTQNDWIYYTNFNDNDCLYKTTMNGNNTKKLTSHYSYEINLIGDWIYYINGMPGKVCRVKVDGTGQETVFKQRATNLIATDKWLFFRMSLDHDSTKLYRSDLDGDGAKVICDSVSEFAIYDDRIYYANSAENHALYVMDLSGGNHKKLNNDYCQSVNVANGFVYYSAHNDHDHLYRIKVDGTEKKMMSEDSCWNINVYNDYIYYRNQTQKGSLYRMNIDGSENIQIAEGNISYINITDNFIIYHRNTENSGYYYTDLEGNNEKQWPFV